MASPALINSSETSVSSTGVLSGTLSTNGLKPTVGRLCVRVHNPTGSVTVSVEDTAITSLSAPGTVTPTTATTGGTLAAATYYYKVTAISGTGETTGSPECSQITTGSTSTVTLNWAAVTGATSYKIYRGTSSNGESVFFASATNSFTDTGAASTAGTVPGANTAQAFGDAKSVVSFDTAGAAYFSTPLITLPDIRLGGSANQLRVNVTRISGTASILAWLEQ